MNLLERLVTAQSRPVIVNAASEQTRSCADCNREIISVSSKHDVERPIVVFFCGHVYHEDCLREHERVSELQKLDAQMAAKMGAVGDSFGGTRHRNSTAISRSIIPPPGKSLAASSAAGGPDHVSNGAGSPSSGNHARRCFKCFDGSNNGNASAAMRVFNPFHR